MADNTENLVLEHLRALREGQEKLSAKLSEISQRVGGIETISGDLFTMYAALSNRLDRLDAALSA